MNNKRRHLEAKRRKLVRKLLAQDPWISGSIAVVHRICGSKGCKCRHNGPKHPAMYLMWKESRRTCALYIPRGLEREVREWVKNYQKLKDILKEVTSIQRKIISLR